MLFKKLNIRMGIGLFVFISNVCLAIHGNTVDLEESDSLMNLSEVMAHFQKPNKKSEMQTFCSGTFIGESRVLSAAHCFEGDLGQISMRISGKEVKITEIAIAEYYSMNEILHPYFKYVLGIEISNDIALVYFDDTTLDTYDRHSLVQTKIGDIEGIGPIHLAGYGYSASIFGIGDGAGTLRVSTPLSLKDSKTINRLELFSASSGACQGDSGGPAMIKTPMGWRQIGIISQADCQTYSWIESISSHRIANTRFKTIWARPL